MHIMCVKLWAITGVSKKRVITRSYYRSIIKAKQTKKWPTTLSCKGFLLYFIGCSLSLSEIILNPCISLLVCPWRIEIFAFKLKQLKESFICHCLIHYFYEIISPGSSFSFQIVKVLAVIDSYKI